MDYKNENMESCNKLQPFEKKVITNYMSILLKVPFCVIGLS